MALENSDSNTITDRVLSGTIHRQTIDDLAPPLRQYFDLEVQQMQPGDYRGKMEFVATRNSAVYREDYPQGTMIFGELLGGRFGVAIPLVGSSRFAGKETTRQLLASAMSGEQIDFLAPQGHNHLVMVVDHSRLEETADSCRVAPASLKALSSRRQGMTIMTSPFAVECIKNTFGQVLDLAVAGQFVARQENFDDLVLDSILSLVDHIDEPYGRPPASVLFLRALEIANQNPFPMRGSVLAAALRVSPRTLHNAFVSATGLAPCQYFLKRRLNQAREALLAAQPGESLVTSIAMDLGFTELGRFSVRYRQLFGESPVETLRRSPRKLFTIPGLRQKIPAAARIEPSGQRENCRAKDETQYPCHARKIITATLFSERLF